MNPEVDLYLDQRKAWRNELVALRKILLHCQLIEEFKWGKPCYTFGGHNVVIIMPLKKYCVLLFCQGALLKDTGGILVQPTENTQAARQLRFTSVQEIAGLELTVKAIIQDAIEVAKVGLEVEYKKPAELVIPAELQGKFAAVPGLKDAFDKLTPGRQRGYVLYFTAAKQAKTRESRIDKCLARILSGKGLQDR